MCSALEELVRQQDLGKVVGRLEDTTLLRGISGNGRDDRTLPAVRHGPVAMYVGNREPYQGVDLLLGGFRHPLKRVPNAQLVIVGCARPRCWCLRG